jgi:STE24 endopeptidase
MNIYAIIILITLMIGYLLDLIADLLNIKHLKTELPPEFKGVYSEEKYKRSQEYLKENTRFGFVTSTFSMVVLLAFWFLGGFNWLDLWLRGMIEHDILRGIAYLGVLLLGNSLLSLPFSIYSTFVIEEKYGFNKTTPKTFILDLAKGLSLSIILGIPLLYGILYILQYFGGTAWLVGWGVVVVFSLIIQFVAPRWIMPLFNKFKPLEEGELRNSIFEYANRIGFSLKNIFVMDGSKRSSKSNAFFTGFGRNKRIALFDTLIENHTTQELVAILAHEIGHYKKKHILQGMAIGIIHTGVIFFLLSLFLTEKGLYNAFYLDNMSVYTGLIFFGMLYSPIEMILSLLMNKLSRKNEFQADEFAAKTIDDHNDMINALKKLSEHNLSNLTPHPFYVAVNYSHPPVISRIRRISEIAGE